jgi:hypothetical protein
MIFRRAFMMLSFVYARLSGIYDTKAVAQSRSVISSGIESAITHFSQSARGVGYPQLGAALRSSRVPRLAVAIAPDALGMTGGKQNGHVGMTGKLKKRARRSGFSTRAQWELFPATSSELS